MHKKTLYLLVLIFGTISTNEGQTPEIDWRSKVDESIWDALSEREAIDFFVLLQQQANTQSQHLATKIDKATYVFQQLESTAQNTQAAVLNLLDSHNANYQSFWIVNAIKTSGDIDLIQSIASQNSVAQILPNQAIRYHKPLKTTQIVDLNTKNGEDNIAWGIRQIRAHLLWDKDIKGAGVVIGGQDTGYEWEHAALKNQYRGSQERDTSHAYNWHDAIHEAHELNVDADNPCGFNLAYPCDDGSHGTHTMGTMIGTFTRGTEVTRIGVAPKAEWIGCRNMERGWGSPETYIECFQWFLAPTDLANQNPDPSKAPHVINNSWSCPTVEGCNESNFTIMRMAISNLRNAGVVVVVSAGNNGPDCGTIDRPAALYGESFVVGASNRADTLARFSSRGPVDVDLSYRIKPDVVAPGVDINSSQPTNTLGLSSGTSMAGPHVAGLVALLIAADPSLAGQVDRIEELIKKSAIPIYNYQNCGELGSLSIPNNEAGYGRVDAWNALAILRPDLTGGIRPDSEDETLRIYPNPMQRTALIVTPTDTKSALLRIHTPMGKLVAYQYLNFERVQQLNLSGLADGVYFITVVNKEKCYTGAILKKE